MYSNHKEEKRREKQRKKKRIYNKHQAPFILILVIVINKPSSNDPLDRIHPSRLPPHRRHKIPHNLPIKRIRRANRIRIRRIRSRASGVDVEARPVHAAPDGLGFGREYVLLVCIHDASDVEFAIDAEFFQDAGFLRGGAGVVVVFEPLEAVVCSCGSGAEWKTLATNRWLEKQMD